MENIPFGKAIIFEEEKKEIINVLSQDVLVNGSKEREFESLFSKFTDTSFAVSLSSCTAGLHLACLNLNLKPTDEVLVSSQTHVATANAVEYCGARPIFIDSEIETGNLDISLIENSITDNTKAIVLVHFLGMPVNMEKLCNIASKYNLAIIEDCALALGSRINGVHVGNFGMCGVFSFYPIKHITTIEGGMLITHSEEFANLVRKQKSFGIDRMASDTRLPGTYDVVTLGFNYRMNELEAALGCVQLSRIGKNLELRERNYKYLEKALLEVDEITLFKSSHDKFKSSYYCFSFMLKESLANYRQKIVQYLNNVGIGTSVYYPKPVPLLKYYREKYRYKESAFPIARRISETSISLPVGPYLSLDNLDYIVSKVKESIFKSRGAVL